MIMTHASRTNSEWNWHRERKWWWCGRKMYTTRNKSWNTFSISRISSQKTTYHAHTRHVRGHGICSHPHPCSHPYTCPYHPCLMSSSHSLVCPTWLNSSAPPSLPPSSVSCRLHLVAAALVCLLRPRPRPPGTILCSSSLLQLSVSMSHRRLSISIVSSTYKQHRSRSSTKRKHTSQRTAHRTKQNQNQNQQQKQNQNQKQTKTRSNTRRETHHPKQHNMHININMTAND